MHKKLLCLVFVVSMSAVGLVAQGAIPIAFGFDVGAPAVLPIDWDASFSYLSAEMLFDPNLTFLLTALTYPATFPDLFEASIDLVVKGWLGPVALYAGGGFAMQWSLVGSAWLWTPFMHITAGVQIWLLDSVAIVASVRSLDELPPAWTLTPQVSLGARVSFVPPRPPVLGTENLFYIWIVIGLGVVALLTYYPHS